MEPLLQTPQQQDHDKIWKKQKKKRDVFEKVGKNVERWFHDKREEKRESQEFDLWSVVFSI